MTTILLAHNDRANREVPTPLRGRAANSRALPADLDRQGHGLMIAERAPLIKRGDRGQASAAGLLRSGTKATGKRVCCRL
jgi:hypothetical protein